MVGRGAELASVGRALEATAGGAPSVILIGGDAGVGKTTFAAHVVEAALGLGYEVMQGGCLAVELNVPFSPVVDAVRPLLRSDPDRFGPAGAQLAELLRDPGARSASQPAGRLLELLRSGLLHVSDSAPVLLVLEDMQWADASTRDLAVHVARNLRGPVCLMLTYRSDDLHRRHPFRACLTEIARSSQVEQIELEALDRDELADLIAGVLGRPPTPALVGAILARSGGNPLFAEELIEAGADGSELPPRLADLFRARLDRLEPATARMLRVAAASGSRIDSELLACVLGLDPGLVDAQIRSAVDFNLLTVRCGRLEFRHELLREAAYDDLLPGERARVHAELAHSLEKRVGNSPGPDSITDAAQLAHHWSSAHELPRALVWSLRAGRQATVLAAPEASAHLDRVLELWDRVPDAAELTATDRVEVLRLAAEAADMAGDSERATALVDEAILGLRDDADPLLASRVYSLRGSFCEMRVDAIGRAAAAERAVELARGTSSVEEAEALAVLARMLGYEFHLAEALDVGRRAVAVAERAGAPIEEAHARLTVGWALVNTGRESDGLEQSARAVALARSMGRDFEVAYSTATLAFQMFVAGRAREAVDLAADAARVAGALGLRSMAGFCVNQQVECQLWLGDWMAAELSLREMTELQRDLSIASVPGAAQTFDGIIRYWRGDLDGALRSFGLIWEHARKRGNTRTVWEALGWLAQVAIRTDRPEGMELAFEVAEHVRDRDSAFALAIGATTLYRAVVAGRGRAAPADHARALSVAGGLLQEAVDQPPPGQGTLTAGHLASAKAWASSAADEPDPAAWEAAVTAWSKPGYLYPATEARLMLAEARLAAGDRDGARAETVRAWAEADALGARGLAEQIATFARRARFPIDGAVGTPSRLDVLTPREREVLALLADGASNRAIGSALFISAKTAGVHVSNVLAKLGVSSRLEAAALAHREGLSA